MVAPLNYPAGVDGDDDMRGKWHYFTISGEPGLSDRRYPLEHDPDKCLVYVASPYSTHVYIEQAPVEDLVAIENHRYNMVCRVTAQMHDRGFLAFSPIAHSRAIAEHRILANDIPRHVGHAFDSWVSFDLRMVQECDIFMMTLSPGWEQSFGMREEAFYAYTRAKRCMLAIDDSWHEVQQRYPVLFAQSNPTPTPLEIFQWAVAGR